MSAATALVTGNTPDASLADEAVAQALANAGLTQASAVLLFLTPEFSRHAQAAVTAAARRARCLQVAGGIAHGVLTEAGWALDRPTVAALVMGDGFSLATGSDEGISPHSSRPPSIGLASASPVDSWLNAAPRFGGVFGDHFGDGTSEHHTPVLWQHSRLSTTPCELSLGTAKVDLAISTGLKPLTAPERIEHCSGFELETLGSQPAARTLLRTLPPEMRDAPARHLHHFSAILFDAPPTPPYFNSGAITPIIDITADHSVTLATRARPGQYLIWAMRQPLSAEAEMRDAIAPLNVKTPAFALMFSCIGRGPFFYGGEDRDLQALRERFPGLPILGAYGTGQLVPTADFHVTRHVQNTVAVALVGEPDGPTSDQPPQ